MKCLLIGDLRFEHNWGAIGTSSAIYRLLEKYELETIRHKNFIYNSDDMRIPREVKIPNFKSKLLFTLQRELGINRQKLKKEVSKTKTENIHHIYDNEIGSDYVPTSIHNFGIQKKEFSEKFPEEHEKIQRADLVVVNGEGTIVNDLPGYPFYRRSGRYTMFMSYIARNLYKKPTFLVNFTYHPENSVVDSMAKQVFPTLDAVSVREPLSLEALSKISVEANFVPDTLFSWALSNEVPNKIRNHAIFGDTSAVKYTGSVFFEKLGKVIEQLSHDYHIIFADGNTPFADDIFSLVKRLDIGWITPRNTSVPDLFEKFRESRFYFSGRWHNSILAACAGCPIVTIGSDSFKTKALQNLFGNKIPYVEYSEFLERPTDLDLKAIETVLDSDIGNAIFDSSRGYAKEVKKFYREI
jgi:hypothetical protein